MLCITVWGKYGLGHARAIFWSRNIWNIPEYFNSRMFGNIPGIMACCGPDILWFDCTIECISGHNLA